MKIAKYRIAYLLLTILFISGGNLMGAPGVFTGNLGEKPESFVEGRVLIKFNKNLDKRNAQAIAHAAGANIEKEAYGNAFQIASVPAGMVPRVVEALNHNPNVEFAHADWIAHASAVPNDPLYFPYQWHLDNPVYGGIEMEQAWDIAGGGDSSIVVAVLDTGIAYENYAGYLKAPDLAGANFVQGYDFINGDSHPNDDGAHGSHVAGTIAQSTNNGLGVAGVAYNTSLMPVKVLDGNGSGSISAIAQGIRYAADNGAHVINMSLGTNANPRFLGALEQAVQYADAAGVLIIASAGNDGRSKLSYPAGYSEVVAVGATRYNETKASYSNYGTGIELCAPGGEAEDLNGDGYYDMVLQQTINPNTLDVTDFGYWFFSGTSMASPHVAGAAALLFSAGVSDAATVRQILNDTADDLGVPGYDTTYGNGLINVAQALQSLGPVDDPPSVVITQPADGATVSGLVLVEVNASDNDPLSEVQFYVDGSLIGVDTTAFDGWSISWNTVGEVDGEHELVASATDSAAQTSGDLILVNVDNIDDLPTVSLISPQDGDSVSGTVSVSASASDDKAVDRVVFFVDGNPLGIDSDGSDGWSADWDTTGLVEGSNPVVSAVAWDDANQPSTPDSVTVTVNNVVPTSIHVGDIDEVHIKGGRDWGVMITVTIHDGSHNPVAGALVSATWGGGVSGSVSGTTNGSGQVSFESAMISKKVPSISLTVDSVSHALAYDSSLNHDPDGDSNGTIIIVAK